MTSSIPINIDYSETPAFSFKKTTSSIPFYHTFKPVPSWFSLTGVREAGRLPKMRVYQGKMRKIIDG
jgi:hypothetical protein